MNEIAIGLAPEAGLAGADGPYPGLRPFLARERDIFFGREQMIDQVMMRLNQRHMVVVHGASGCGKSSLVAAGVLPQLIRRRERQGRALKTATFSPGAKPMQGLVQTLRELCGIEGAPASLEDVYRAISSGAEARANVARLAADAGADQLCIVVDQFEELFRFAEDEGFEDAREFTQMLVLLGGCASREPAWWEDEDAAAPPQDGAGAEVSFILTMRSEFLGNCARYPGLAEAINETQYLLPNMGHADLIRAIREPAEVFGGAVEHRLAERMADDALHEEDSLPLVQHALLQLWLQSDDRNLTLDDYERAVEASTPCTEARRHPLGAILAAHADQILDEAATDDASRSAAEFIFRALTKKDSESRAIRCPQKFSRLVKISGVPEDRTREIIDAFRRDGASFLTPYAAMEEAIDGDTVVDISHEALIRAWPRMSDTAIDDKAQPVGWVEREAQDAMLWRWLAVHADFFRSNPRAYLDGATSERLGKWFKRLKVRPDWVRPHLVKSTGKDDVTQEPEWQAVDHLLNESHDKTWIDRARLHWWRKLGWFSILLLLAVIAGGAIGTYFLVAHWQEIFQQEEAKDRNDRTVAKQDSRRVAAIVRGTDDLSKLVDRVGAAAVVEVVDQQTAEAATAGGSFINSPDGEGYMWVGTIARDGTQINNLRGSGGRPISPAAVGVGRDYNISDNTIVRAARPAPGARTRATGIIAARSLVTIRQASVPVEGEGGREYWARVRLRVGLSRVSISVANVTVQNGRAMLGQLSQIGYRAALANPQVDASNRADVLYCHDEDRLAAVRLAAILTRWIRQNTDGDVRVTPVPGDDCEGVPRNQLILLLDLAPAPSAAPEAL